MTAPGQVSAPHALAVVVQVIVKLGPCAFRLVSCASSPAIQAPFGFLLQLVVQYCTGFVICKAHSPHTLVPSLALPDPRTED